MQCSSFRLSATPWIAARQASLSITNSQTLLKPMSMSRWCHPSISSSVVPFSSCPQPLPESGSFPINQPFACGGQSIGVSASTSVLPVNTQDWSPLRKCLFSFKFAEVHSSFSLSFDWKSLFLNLMLNCYNLFNFLSCAEVSKPFCFPHLCFQCAGWEHGLKR